LHVKYKSATILVLINRWPRRWWDTPEPGPQHMGGAMDNRRILRRALSDEARRTILRESLARYRNELMDDEERQLLLGRIKRFRRQLKLVTTR